MQNFKDNKLVRLVKKNGDNNAFLEVCKRYENVFYRICQNYSTILSQVGVNVQDIFDEKNFIIYNCILSFKPTKGVKLSTYIGNYARYLCLNSINSRKLTLRIDNNNELTSFIDSLPDKDVNSLKIKEENYNFIIKYLPTLQDKRISDVFQYRYFGNKKMIWSKVAKKMKLSTQTVVNLHSKGIRLIKKEVKKQFFE